jgi:4-hydroxybenzoate polyprenyltransferase/phosphoserine phosphatase
VLASCFLPVAEAAVSVAVPLCVDLDGTLVRTDTLHESVLEMLKTAPAGLVQIPGWLMRGKAWMKHRIAERVRLDASSLPYRADVLAVIDAARQEGRPVVLVTAAAAPIAQAVADHLGVFDAVISSNDATNLSAHTKAGRLVDQFGERGFDYVGNAPDDVPVWRRARRAIVVSNRPGLAARASAVCGDMRQITDADGILKPLIRCLRPHQWLKNLLIFVPVVAGHKANDPASVMAALLAFVAFSAAASFGYLVNDLLDLQADRMHVRKRNRPFASGALSVSTGILLSMLLLGMAFITAFFLPPLFLKLLVFYLVLTLSYSLRLKRQVIVDVILLAGLYTLRIIAGAAATSIAPSFWLLAFSMFMFLSLAIVKRYSELLLVPDDGNVIAGRGYLQADLPVLMALGTGSGLMSVLVIALYVNSPIVASIYAEPVWLWLAPPTMLYWVARLWMKTHRGEVHDDPVMFAIRDRQSLIAVAVLGAMIAVAAAGLRFW